MNNRILGIDYGTKRIGIAISDPQSIFGQPYSVVKNSKNALAEILDIIKKEQVTEIVLGESKDFKGEDNAVMSEIRDFKKDLENAVSLPVIFEPEFLTSHQAEYFQGKHDLLDASSAALILQSYLDKKKNKQEKVLKEKEEVKEKQEKKDEKSVEQKTAIGIDDFAKVEIRAGKILKAEAIPTSNKLLKLEVDFGEGKPRQVLSGIAKHFPDATTLVGRTVGFVTNLQPRLILGLESQAMILAVSNEAGAFSLLSVDSNIDPGTKVK